MFKILILICAIGTQPQDCSRETALDVINGPSADSEVTCMLHSQAYVAEVGLVRNDREYMKAICTRSSIGKTVG